MGYPEVNETNVYLCTGDPLPSDILVIVKSLLNDSFSDSFAGACASCVFVCIGVCVRLYACVSSM